MSNSSKTCPTCNGRGRFKQGEGLARITMDCPDCGGTGTRPTYIDSTKVFASHSFDGNGSHSQFCQCGKPQESTNDPVPSSAKEAKPAEHIFTEIPGSTAMQCSCRKVFAATSEQQQHRQWHLDLAREATALSDHTECKTVICACHDERIKTKAPCDLCRKQKGHEFCWTCRRLSDHQDSFKPVPGHPTPNSSMGADHFVGDGCVRGDSVSSKSKSPVVREDDSLDYPENVWGEQSKDQGQSVNDDKDHILLRYRGRIGSEYDKSALSTAREELEQLISQRVVEELEGLKRRRGFGLVDDPLLRIIEQRISELKGGKE